MEKILLLGAGFSYDFGMPLASELTDVLMCLFDTSNIQKMEVLFSKHEPYGQDRPINSTALRNGLNTVLEFKEQKNSNYEELIGNLEIRSHSGGTQSDRDSYHYLLSKLYKLIYLILSHYQITSYGMMYDANFKWYAKLPNLLNFDTETWITTLNHDIFLECLAIDLSIPLSYGNSDKKMMFPISNKEMDKHINFVRYDRNDYSRESANFVRGSNGINLVKLHGGLGEYEYDDRKIVLNLDTKKHNSKELLDDFVKSLRLAHYYNGIAFEGGRDTWATGLDGNAEVLMKAMLTGQSKYTTKLEPKADEVKLILFDSLLKESKQLTIIGYGFGDRHVNNKISNAMLLNSDLRLEIIDPCIRKLPEFLDQFDYSGRVREALSGTTEWMHFVEDEKWNYENVEAMKNNGENRKKIHLIVKNLLPLIIPLELL